MTLEKKVKDAGKNGQVAQSLSTDEMLQVKRDVERVWNDIVAMFGIKDPRPMPALALYEISKSGELTVNFLHEVLPSYGGLVKQVFPKRFFPTSFYDPEANVIFLDINRITPGVVVEEVTHSLIFKEELPFDVPVDCLREYSGRFLKDLYAAAKSNGCTKGFSACIDEFFAPIVETALLGRTDDSEQCDISELTRRYPIWSENRRSCRALVNDTLVHIPQVAGERLVKNYNGDIKRLLQDHPGLLAMSSIEIWHYYCVPLLVLGKVDWVKR